MLTIIALFILAALIVTYALNTQDRATKAKAKLAADDLVDELTRAERIKAVMARYPVTK